MADKLTPLILDALARALAAPDGSPLFASRSAPGLFPAVAAAKPAAQKCLQEGLIRVVRTDAQGKQLREFYAGTPAGLKFLVEQASPKQVLDDFVRVLEERRDEVRDLIAAAERMSAALDGMTAAVAAVLPKVHSDRLPSPTGGEGGLRWPNPSPPPNCATACSPACTTGRRPTGCPATARCRNCSAA